MTKVDPKFTCLCTYQWSGERGQNILDKTKFVEADLKKWVRHLQKLEEHCKPRGSKLIAATQYKVLKETWNYLSTSKHADKLPMHVDGQRKPKTWLAEMQFSLDSKI